MIRLYPVVLLALAAVLPPGPSPAQATKTEKQKDERPKNPFDAPFRFNSPRGQPVDARMEGWLRTLIRLREAYLLAEGKGHDEAGRPSCDSDEFERLRAEVEGMPVEKGWFWYVAYGSKNKAYRRAAFWRSLFLPPSQRMFQFIDIMPYEPDAAIRSEVLTLVLPLLDRHLGRRGVAMPENVPGHVKASWNVEAAKRRFTYQFNGLAHADLIRSRSTRDRILSLRVLSVVARTRKDMAAALLLQIKRRIPDCLRSDNEPLRKEARLFLDALDGDPPCPPEAGAAIAHYEKLLRKVFPDVRRRGGVCGLYPGPDLDRLVALVSELLAKDRLGKFTRSWELARGNKKFVWGLELGELDESLAVLGLVEGDVLTHLNSVPIQGNEQMLKLIRQELARGARTFVLQWIDTKHRPRAIRYRLEKDDR